MPQKKQTVSAGMHYAVMLALVISLITTFLLGILITEVLWNTGLDYFGNLKRQAQIEKARAQLLTSNYEGIKDSSGPDTTKSYPPYVRNALALGCVKGAISYKRLSNIGADAEADLNIPLISLEDINWALNPGEEVASTEELDPVVYMYLSNSYDLGFYRAHIIGDATSVVGSSESCTVLRVDDENLIQFGLMYVLQGLTDEAVFANNSSPLCFPWSCPSISGLGQPCTGTCPGSLICGTGGFCVAECSFTEDCPGGMGCNQAFGECTWNPCVANPLSCSNTYKPPTRKGGCLIPFNINLPIKGKVCLGDEALKAGLKQLDKKF
jgi:hypothetical protein